MLTRKRGKKCRNHQNTLSLFFSTCCTYFIFIHSFLYIIQLGDKQALQNPLQNHTSYLFTVLYTRHHSYALSYTVLILKAGCNVCLKLYSNSWGLSWILNYSGLIYIRYLNTAFWTNMVIVCYQFSFKKYSSCAHAIYITKCVVDYIRLTDLLLISAL